MNRTTAVCLAVLAAGLTGVPPGGPGAAAHVASSEVAAATGPRPNIVVVMADDELSLIRIKQDRRGLPREGVRLGEMDWPGLARAMGMRGSRAGDFEGLRQQLNEAMRADGPSLVEARIDAAPYGAMLRAIRPETVETATTAGSATIITASAARATRS